MKSKVIMGIAFTLLLIGMLTSIFNIQPVRASVTIYIKADGSVQGTDKIQRDGNLYTFTDNIINQSIIVERDDIVIDGANYTLQGAGSIHGFELTTRSNVTIQNTNIKGFKEGIWLGSSSNNTVSGNTITNNDWHGIYIHESSNNTISGNIITNNNAYSGVWLGYSWYNTVSGNTIINNTMGSNGFGVRVWAYSSYNTVSGNNITKNIVGVRVSAYCNNIIISGNNVIDNTYGVSISGSSYSIVSGNTIKNSACGIKVANDLDNYIFHNNIVDNTQQVYDKYWDDQEHYFPSINIWDDGYPSGGNYWSNYTGVDSNHDGIGDTPHIIYENNTDRYPLMNPWTTTETSVQVEGKDYPVVMVSNTTISQMTATQNTLSFNSSGTTGEKGYINVIFPMVNTTAIKVFIDGNKLTPPPFPVINSNGTHYFIYFEFTLSTHNITIQFAPIAPVGGIYIPVNKLELLAPYIGLTVLLAVAVIAVGYVKKRKRHMVDP